MKQVRKPKIINKVVMCSGSDVQIGRCPGCEFEFKIKKENATSECPNCGQEFSVDEFISFYNETH